MKYTIISTESHCKRIALKCIGPIAVLLQSLLYGLMVGWPIVHIPVLLSPESPIKMTKDEISWMMTFFFVGNMLSPVPVGYLMDRYGRKTVLLYASVLPAITWSMISVCTTGYQLWFSWFCAGIWSGVLYTVAPVYQGETATPERRGFITTIFSVTRRLGIILQFLISTYLVNISTAIMVTIPVITIVTMIFVPESPYFHLMRNDRASAQDSLCALRGKNAKDSKVIEEELNDLEQFVQEQMKNSGRFSDLITVKSNRRTLIIIETIVILLRVSETGSILGYITAILPPKIFNLFEPSQCVMAIEIARLSFGSLSSVLIDKLGRKLLMFCASIVSGTFMVIMSVWYYLSANTDINLSSTNWIPFVCLLITNMSHCLGLVPVYSSLRSEYFPINVKAKLTAVTSITFALVSSVVSKTFMSVADRFGMHFVCWIFAVSCFLNAVVAVFFIIETKGKTLKMIQNELNVKHVPDTTI